MSETKRVPPPEPIPDPILIRVRMGSSQRIFEIPGKHFNSPVKTFLGWYVGSFHHATVKLPEPK